MSFEKIKEATIAILATIGAIYGVVFGVNYLVDQRLNNEDVLMNIAAKIRPSIVFDEKNRVLHDASGSVYIEKIKVEKYSRKVKGDNLEESNNFKITVDCKKHLPAAPILECMTGSYHIEAERGAGLQWIYRVEDRAGIIVTWSHPEERTDVFRVEIIP